MNKTLKWPAVVEGRRGRCCTPWPLRPSSFGFAQERSAEDDNKFTDDLSALLRSGCFLQAETGVPAMLRFQIENRWSSAGCESQVGEPHYNLPEDAIYTISGDFAFQRLRNQPV